jgi:hypothetical protein
MTSRRTVLALAVAALLLSPALGSAQGMPMATSAPNAAQLTPVEQQFYDRAAATLRRLYPNPPTAEKAGYFRFANEDRTGAISYVNPNYFNSPEDSHPQQLWFDVNGRLLGADFSQTVAAHPIPTLFELQRARFHHIPLHIHFGLKNPDGSIRYGLFVPAPAYTAAGGDALHPTADILVKMGKAASAAQVAFVFALLENWDAQMWVIPNPAGQFADANPNVKPSAGGGAGETQM